MRPLLLLLLAPVPASAQAPSLATILPATPEKSLSATLEGTIDGAPSRATVRFNAPDSARVQVAEVEGVSARRDLQAQGETTLQIENGRARRASFNGLSSWFRAGNEPLLVALGPWLSPLSELPKFYTLQTTRDGEATIIEARANEVGKYLGRDLVRSGGGGGARFYAARAREAWNRPARMRLRVEGGRIVGREDFRSQSTRPIQKWTWRYENGRPVLIEARDSRDALRARWNLVYDAEPKPIEPLVTPREVLVEGAPDARPDARDAAESAFALGVSLARGERYAASAAQLARAGQARPRAIAVPLALLEVALATRSESLGQSALLKIAAIETEASPLYALARARLALQMRSKYLAASLRALPGALASATAAQKLQGADLLRAGGERDQALELLLPLLDEKTPAPLAVGALSRLSEMFSPLEAQEKLAARAKITSPSTWGQAARTLLGQLGQEDAKLDLSAAPEARAVLAQSAASDGRDEEAIRLWKEVAAGANESLWLRARLALAQIAARRKDASGALAALEAHREAWPFLDGEAARENWTRSLLSAWIKADKLSTLRGALGASTSRPLSRANSSTFASDEADARLLASVVESEGDASSTLALVRTQAARFRGAGGVRAAWWQGRLGEVLSASAQEAPPEAGGQRRVRDRLYEDAERAVDAAIALDPAQPFYAEQKVLLAARRVALQGPVTDAGTGVRDRERARAAIESLRKSFPLSTDALISSGLAQLTMSRDREAARDLSLAVQQLDAVRDEERGDAGSERVARVSARASLAASLRRAGDPEESQRLYAELFAGARTPLEQGAFALNWLNSLFEARNPGGAAAVLSNVAASPWKPSATQSVLAQVLAPVSIRAPWRVAVRAALEQALANDAAPVAQAGAQAQEEGAASVESRRSLREGAILTAAYLDFSALNRARRALAQAEPGGAPRPSPAESQRNFEVAVAVWRTDLTRLEQLAAGATSGAAGQALALLAQDALLRGQSAEAAGLFERATKAAPDDEEMALALSRTLAGANPAAPMANADVARILQARDALLLRGAQGTSSLAQAAQMSRLAGRAQDAQLFNERAQALAFFDESVSAGDYDALAAPATP